MRTEDFITGKKPTALTTTILFRSCWKGAREFMCGTSRVKIFRFPFGLTLPSARAIATQVIEALKEQASKLTLVSRAFYSDALGEYMEFAVNSSDTINCCR